MTIQYKNAGVDIDEGSKAIELIKGPVASTHSKSVLTGLGSFGALYDLKEVFTNYQDPVLVQSIDGVGTKLSVAKMMNKFDTVGEDIVNHSINDILVMGARALTFLDYVAHDKLDAELMADIVKGMCKACKENDISLVGGETAEMPGTYQVGEHDIVGSITGVVERSKIITGDKVKVGDIAIGIESSGLHTNGYSLARKILFADNNYSVDDIIPELNIQSLFEKLPDARHASSENAELTETSMSSSRNEHNNADGTFRTGSKSLGEILLVPHRSYAKPVLEILDAGIEINAMAHITGGGFIENIPRVLPESLSIEINKGSWKVLPLYNFMQKLASVPDEEMYRVFNMGIGLILLIDPADQVKVEKILSKYSYGFSEIGKIVNGNRKVILK